MSKTDTHTHPPGPDAPEHSTTNAAGQLLLLPVDDVTADPLQPRQHFGGIDALAESIRDRGLMQPIVVRPAGNGYTVVAGERRLRAARQAGLAAVPAIVRDVDEGEALVLAVLENAQRADLRPLERAGAFKRLMEQGFTQAEIGKLTGLDQSSVSNAIRLLGLPEAARTLIDTGALTAAHGEALCALLQFADAGAARAVELARQATDGAWPVTDLRRRVAEARDELAPRLPQPEPPRSPEPEPAAILPHIPDWLGVGCWVRQTVSGRVAQVKDHRAGGRLITVEYPPLGREQLLCTHTSEFVNNWTPAEPPAPEPAPEPAVAATPVAATPVADTPDEDQPEAPESAAAPALPAPAPPAPPPAPEPAPPAPAPAANVVALLPADEHAWLQSQGLTPGVAVARLRELMAQPTADDAVARVRFLEAQVTERTQRQVPADLWARCERICGLLEERPTVLAFLEGRIESAERVLGITGTDVNEEETDGNA